MKLLLWLLLAALVSAKVRYDKHQVFRLVPENVDQLQALKDLQKQTHGVSWGGLNISNENSSIIFLQMTCKPKSVRHVYSLYTHLDFSSNTSVA